MHQAPSTWTPVLKVESHRCTTLNRATEEKKKRISEFPKNGIGKNKVGSNSFISAQFVTITFLSISPTPRIDAA